MYLGDPLFFFSSIFNSPEPPFMIAFSFLCRTLAVLAFFLFGAPMSSAAEKGPDTPSVFSPEAPRPEACRECAGLPYYRPSAAAAASGNAASENQQKGTSGAPPRLEREGSSKRSHLSSDPRVNSARRLLKRNRFPEVLEILRPLATDHPDQTDVRFLLGLAASRGSQQSEVGDEERVALLDEAIAAFRFILIRQPGLVRVRLELALAFYLKEEDALAQDHFERALVGKPPAALVANISRFLNVMRARRRWTGYFGFSLAPDTNINAASDVEVIYINGLPFRRGAGQRASSAIGVVGWGGAEYQFPLANRWRLRSGFNVNHREYKGGRFDQTFLAGYIGPRWLISRNTEMSLLASASQRWWGGSSFNYDVGARLEVEHRVFAGLRLSGRATWSDRTYQQNTFLEGPLMVFSLGARYVPFPIMQVNALVGYIQQEAAARHWNSTGYWTRVGTNVALPWGFTVGLSGEFRWTDFEDGWPQPFRPDGSARRDQTRILGATLLNRAITVYGFSPQIAFSHQVRDSNAQLLDFKRNLVEMRWVRQF